MADPISALILKPIELYQQWQRDKLAAEVAKTELQREYLGYEEPVYGEEPTPEVYARGLSGAPRGEPAPPYAVNLAGRPGRQPTGVRGVPGLKQQEETRLAAGQAETVRRGDILEAAGAREAATPEVQHNEWMGGAVNADRIDAMIATTAEGSPIASQILAPFAEEIKGAGTRWNAYNLLRGQRNWIRGSFEAAIRELKEGADKDRPETKREIQALQGYLEDLKDKVFAKRVFNFPETQITEQQKARADAAGVQALTGLRGELTRELEQERKLGAPKARVDLMKAQAAGLREPKKVTPEKPSVVAARARAGAKDVNEAEKNVFNVKEMKKKYKDDWPAIVQSEIDFVNRYSKKSYAIILVDGKPTRKRLPKGVTAEDVYFTAQEEDLTVMDVLREIGAQ